MRAVRDRPDPLQERPPLGLREVEPPAAQVATLDDDVFAVAVQKGAFMKRGQVAAGDSLECVGRILLEGTSLSARKAIVRDRCGGVRRPRRGKRDA